MIFQDDNIFMYVWDGKERREGVNDGSVLQMKVFLPVDQNPPLFITSK